MGHGITSVLMIVSQDVDDKEHAALGYTPGPEKGFPYPDVWAYAHTSYMGISKNREPKNKIQYLMIPIIRTPKYDPYLLETLIYGYIDSLGDAWWKAL